MPEDHDPIEGFQLVNFDEDKKIATVVISSSLLENAKQREALTAKAIEIIKHDHGKTVHGVEFVERPPK